MHKVKIQKTYFPLIISLSVVIIITALVFFLSYQNTDGIFVYSLDDAYIHLAYAKNIFLHNVWGITSHGFTSTTSSPLWTLLITAVFFLTGINIYIPFIFNVLISLALVLVIFRILNDQKLPAFYTGAVLIFIIIFTPFSIHIFSGMEHLLHTLLAVMFINIAAVEFAGRDRSFTFITPAKLSLTVLSFLMMMVRYESIFLIFIAVILFTIKKELRLVISMVLSGILGSSIFGIKSVLNGRSFFPDSVMLKNNLYMTVTDILGGEPVQKIMTFLDMNKKFIVLFILTIILLFIVIKKHKEFRNYISSSLIILLSTAVLQKLFVSSTFFRYDSYLLISFICFDAIAVNYILKGDPKIYRMLTAPFKSALAILALTIMILYFSYKTFYIDKTVTAVKNIYEQQYQMAAFVNEFYTGSSVALNDIGAVNFYADIYCTDLIGLGSPEIADARLNNNFNKEFITYLSRKNNVKIAIIYDEWFDHDVLIPDEWKPAGKWKITDNFICGSDEVTFYATSQEAYGELINDLRIYSAKLPPDVLQSGDYTQ